MKKTFLSNQAKEFRSRYNLQNASNLKQRTYQKNLIVEEFKEVLEAEGQLWRNNTQTHEELLKELADLVYVVFQYAATAGFELDEALDRVHNSNMSKLVKGKPVKDETGKVMKGPNYKPPYLEDIV